MPTTDLDRALFDSAEEVLENMFFTGIAAGGPPCPGIVGPWISARLSFRGNPSGTFGVSVPLETGRKIAASFLGMDADAVTEPQTGEVICELANMLCGSVLSRVEKEVRFDLSHPELETPGGGCAVEHTAGRQFVLEDAQLVVWLDLGLAP